MKEALSHIDRPSATARQWLADRFKVVQTGRDRGYLLCRGPKPGDLQLHHRRAWNGPGGVREQALQHGIITTAESELMYWAVEHYRDLYPVPRHALNQVLNLLFHWRRNKNMDHLRFIRPDLFRLPAFGEPNEERLYYRWDRARRRPLW